MRQLPIVTAAWLGFVLPAAAGAGALECAPPAGDLVVCTVDRVWSGAPARFGAVASGDYLFVAYYAADRQMTAARVDLRARLIERIRLPSRFAGWDSHNALVVALDASNRLHLAGNMHGTPLDYYRGATPLSVADLARSTMTGRHEDHVTYPEFMRDAAGDLLFLYRDGRSGNGAWRLNRLAADRWEPATPAPLFAAGSAGQTVSAYFQKVRATDGRYHFAVVWRRSPDVATNFRLSYVSTADFVTWEDGAGRSIAAPVGPADGQVVFDGFAGSGLVNNATISLDPQGRAVIVYTRYADDGRNAVYAARRAEGGRWFSRLLAEAERRTEMTGGGSLPAVPSFSPVRFGAGARITVALPGEPSRQLTLDPQTLVPIETVAPSPSSPAAPPPTADLAAPRLITFRIATPICRGGEVTLSWHVQGSNRDIPRQCTPAEPTACAPPPNPLQLSLRCPTGG